MGTLQALLLAHAQPLSLTTQAPIVLTVWGLHANFVLAMLYALFGLSLSLFLCRIYKNPKVITLVISTWFYEFHNHAVYVGQSQKE